MQLLITDLDNTLYDWVTFFAKAMQAMVGALIPLLGADEATLLAELKAVHQRYRNSEQPFAVLEIESVKRRFGDLPAAALLEKLEGPLARFNEARKLHLQLYPTVEDTLRLLEQREVVIVGHTEATAINACWRLRELGILRFFRRLYVLEGELQAHPAPDRAARFVPPRLVRVVSREERKPNPRLLRHLCEAEGVPPEQATFVGDSLTRDMAMAKAAGVRAVWAKYGTVYEHKLWEVLTRVTHWSDEDVIRERGLREHAARVQPDAVIDRFEQVV